MSTVVYSADGTFVWSFKGRGRAEAPNNSFIKNLVNMWGNNATYGLKTFVQYYPKLEELLMQDDSMGRRHLEVGTTGVAKYMRRTAKELAMCVDNVSNAPYPECYHY